MADPLELLPAVDVRAGRAVQLVADQLGSTRDFGDPLEAARRWQAAGAPWIHLVDLDAAFGDGQNLDAMASIIGALDVPVQLSGGIVDDETLTGALGTGCRRAVLGTAALRDRRWCTEALEREGERLVVGLDVRGDSLIARGSGVGVGPLVDALTWLDDAACARYVVTDVDRDGSLTGPNLDLLAEVSTTTSAPVVACGGISELEDLAALRAVGVEGAIVGSAVYEGRFSVEDALAVATS